MAKLVIHTDDLPPWAVRKEKVPRSYLDHLSEAVHPSPDGKGMMSAEEIMLRQQFDAAIKNNSRAMHWLLRRIIAENAAELAAFPKRPSVVIQGIHYFEPLGPVLALLGLAIVHDPEEAGEGNATIELTPWFLEELEKRCPAEKLGPVKAWLDAGGKQKPRLRQADRSD